MKQNAFLTCSWRCLRSNTLAQTLPHLIIKDQCLKEIGLECFIAAPGARTPTVTTIKVPEGVDWKAVTVYGMEKYKLEIAGGLGPTAGKVW